MTPLNIRHIITLLALASLFCVGSSLAQKNEGYTQSVAIIGHLSVSADTLMQQDLLELYSLEENKWSDGSLVVLVDQKEKSWTKKLFYMHLSREPREMKKIWMRAILSGEGRTPLVAKTSEEVIRKVSETPGAVGYVEAGLATSAVKILAIIKIDSKSQRSGI